MAPVALALILGCCLSVLARYGLARAGRPTWPCTLALGLISLGTWLAFVQPTVSRQYSATTPVAYHYLLGSKYFAELEYHDLYRFTALAADENGSIDLSQVRRVRNLDNYRRNGVRRELRKARERREQVFRPQRWEEFKHDVARYARGRSSKTWQRLLTDHGFNPPPSWNVLPSWVANRLDLGRPGHRRLAAYVDLLLLLGALGLTAWLAGLDDALLVFNFCMLAWYNESHQVGPFFGFIWLAALLVAISLLRRQAFVGAGAALGVAASFRIFPLLLLFGPLLLLGRALLLRRGLPREWLRFVGAFAAVCALLGVLGFSQGRGVQTTRSFVENMAMHSERIQFQDNKFGVRTTLTSHKAAEGHRRRWGRAHPGLFQAGGLLVLLITAAGVLVRRDDDAWALPLGWGAIFGLLSVSRYYYLVLAVFLVPGRKRASGGFATFSALLVLASDAVFWAAEAAGWSRWWIFAAGDWMFGAMALLLPGFLLVAALRVATTSAPRP